jgi:hypothetical protein
MIQFRNIHKVITGRPIDIYLFITDVFIFFTIVFWM